MYLCETASFVRVVKGLLPAEGELEAPTTAFPFLKLFRRYSINRVNLPQHLADGNHEKEETFVNNNTIQKAEEEEEQEEKVSLKEQDELSWFPELHELEETLDPSRDGEQLTQQEEEEAVSLKEQNELSLFLELQDVAKRQEEELKQSGDGKDIKQEEKEEEGKSRKEQGELASFLELMEIVRRQEELLKQPEDGEKIKEKEKDEKNMEEEEGVNLNEQDELSLFLELQELVKRQEEMLKQPEDEKQIKEEKKSNNTEEEKEEEGGSLKEQDELALFLELQEMVKAQEKALEQLKGVEVIKQKSRKRVTFSLDNVDFPVKERELYNGREYFKYRRRLLTLRPELGREEMTAPAPRPSRIPVPRPARTASSGNPPQPRLLEPLHTPITTPPRRPSRIPMPRPARTASQPPFHNPLHTLTTITNRPRPAPPSPNTHKPTSSLPSKTNTPPSALPSPPTPPALSEE
ncbi:golgin subfamily A member 6-like protein 1 [Eriocheir sinensis]|uniref:golgin subfamily A member 6-like protein 1 n=1 Tax=Eriocheir sinensis TaxID=95602 RepID=UPI0021C7A0A2|nr:golgin subfamily A member 6-like protein 1 [Eriocheir sinensis]